MPKLEEVTNPDPRIDRRDAILSDARKLVADAVAYRREYPVSSDDMSRAFLNFVERVVEVLHAELNLITPTPAPSTSEPPTAVFITIPPRLKRRRSDSEEVLSPDSSTHATSSRKKRKVEPVIVPKSEPNSESLSEHDEELHRIPFERSYAFYKENYGHHPVGQAYWAGEPRATSQPSEVSAQDQEAAGWLLSLRQDTSPPGPSAGPSRARAHARTRAIRSAPSTPSEGSVRRSMRIQKRLAPREPSPSNS